MGTPRKVPPNFEQPLYKEPMGRALAYTARACNLENIYLVKTHSTPDMVPYWVVVKSKLCIHFSAVAAYWVVVYFLFCFKRVKEAQNPKP